MKRHAVLRSHGISATRGNGPRIAGTGVKVAHIVDAFAAGTSSEDLADAWKLSLDEVEAALRFEMCRRSRRKEHAWARKLWEAGR